MGAAAMAIEVGGGVVGCGPVPYGNWRTPVSARVGVWDEAIVGVGDERRTGRELMLRLDRGAVVN